MRFFENLQKKLEEKEYDCIFSFDYIPLLSYAAKEENIMHGYMTVRNLRSSQIQFIIHAIEFSSLTGYNISIL